MAWISHALRKIELNHVEAALGGIVRDTSPGTIVKMQPVPMLDHPASPIVVRRVLVAAHDIWLGEYSRMLSTPEYYRVCSDIIADVCEMFGTPKLFSIGYDEESPRLQRNQNFCVCRQGELWWHDLLWFVAEVEKRGVRAQMAADYAWAHKDEYLKKAPRSVLQTNWYYGAEFDPAKMNHPEWLLTYDELEKAGFDQFPGCSNHAWATNIGDTGRYCRKHISPNRLKGFQVSIWRYTMPEYDQRHYDAIDQLAAAI